jgi:tRNA nucleotidyltransferase (CCA-adding enzyme)
MQTVVNQSNQLKDLRAIFVAAGFDMWFVGGCVRDALCGKDAKDVDLATSATPEEMIDLFGKNGVRFVPTGLAHGTITALLDEPYEITSLRTETDHDGRWAKVEFTRDLTADLSRRDLTVNAIAMDFDGNIIDPFDGRADLEANRVRFVGNAEERMREDYLRILRFFRFHARIAGAAPLDADAIKAIERTRAGLGQISVERIWAEMAKIISGPAAAATLEQMRSLTIFEIIGMPMGMIAAVKRAREQGVTDPASLVGVYVLETSEVEQIAKAWKWSAAERDRALFVSREWPVGKTSAATKRWKELLVDGVAFEWVADLMRLADVDPAVLADWSVPKMPVNGGDLMRAGVKPGPDMGAALRAMTRVWKDSDYAATKDELLATLAANDV